MGDVISVMTLGFKKIYIYLIGFADLNEIEVILSSARS
jgi:hypothetical protein